MNDLEVGDRFSWETIGGQTHEGVVVELDGNVIVVACDDGVERCVEG